MASRTRDYGAHVVKVVQRGQVRIYVYDERGHRHHRPHCHVYWPDGAAAVDLDSMQLLVGMNPPASAWDLIREHLEELRRAWYALNRERTST